MASSSAYMASMEKSANNELERSGRRKRSCDTIAFPIPTEENHENRRAAGLWHRFESRLPEQEAGVPTSGSRRADTDRI